MNKWRKKIHKVAMFMVLFGLFPFMVHAEPKVEPVTIERYPAEELFRIENAKPGDYAYRTMIIRNPHDRDIYYSLDVTNTGDLILFNELLLKVTKEDEVLFDGKLKDYEGFTERPLAAETEETLGFELKFPEELGNEFQGTRAEFQLRFTAMAQAEEGIVDGIIGGGGKPVAPKRDLQDDRQIDGIHGPGSGLPETSTNIFTFLGMGIILLLIGVAVRNMNRIKKETNE